MNSSTVTVTKFINGVPQTPTIHAATKGGYILCVNDAGVSGYSESVAKALELPTSRTARRSTSLSAIVANWFDLGGEGGNARVYHADGSALSAGELAAAREQLGEMA
jgi:hypothetical protein